MQKFIGVKMVEAEKMILVEAINKGYYRKDTKLDLSSPGYHVKYHDGYHSWSPKEVFEKAYLQLEDGEVVHGQDVNRLASSTDSGYLISSIYDSLKIMFKWAKEGLSRV